MHTARLLTVSPSMHCAGGRGLHNQGWSALQGGGLPCRGGGLPCQGGCLLARGVVSQYALRQTPPLWTEFLTHATENITLPQTSFAGGNYMRTLSFTVPVLSGHLDKLK